MPRLRETERRRARLALGTAQSSLQHAHEALATADAAVEAAADVPEQLGRALAARRTAQRTFEETASALLNVLRNYQLATWTDAQLVEMNMQRMRAS